MLWYFLQVSLGYHSHIFRFNDEFRALFQIWSRGESCQLVEGCIFSHNIGRTFLLLPLDSCGLFFFHPGSRGIFEKLYVSCVLLTFRRVLYPFPQLRRCLYRRRTCVVRQGPTGNFSSLFCIHDTMRTSSHVVCLPSSMSVVWSVRFCVIPLRFWTTRSGEKINRWWWNTFVCTFMQDFRHLANVVGNVWPCSSLLVKVLRFCSTYFWLCTRSEILYLTKLCKYIFFFNSFIQYGLFGLVKCKYTNRTDIHVWCWIFRPQVT